MTTLTIAGASIPPIILGTASVGSVVPDPLVPASSRETAFQYLDTMLEAGCTALDIAASYQVGGTERVIGHWMASRRNRDRLFLITKGGLPYPLLPHRLTRKALTAELHGSLRRLKTEQVDLYLLHRDEPSAALEPILECLVSFQRAGQIKAWGVSNWTDARIGAIDALARSSNAPSVAASSPHLSLLEWRSPPWAGCVSIAGDANREARAFYARAQLPVLAWSPLGRGFFLPGADGSTDRTYGTAANLARRERAGRLAEKRGVTAPQIALAYVLCQAFPVAAVVAASTAEKIKRNLAAAELRLTAAEIRWLESGEEQLAP